MVVILSLLRVLSLLSVTFLPLCLSSNHGPVVHFRGNEYSFISSSLLAPTLTECLVENWEHMACLWEPADLGPDTEITLKFKTNQPGIKHWTDCDRVSPGRCEISNERRFHFVMHLNYFVKICVSKIGESLEICSEQERFNPTEIVRPARVERISPIDLTSRSAELKLEVSDRQRVVFYVNVENGDDSKELKTNNSSINLTDLIPYTKYVVTVKSIPLVMVSRGVFAEKGYFSDPKTFTFQTKPDVPDENPKLLPGSFHFEYSISPVGNAYVDIFWQKVDEKFQNGKLNYTSITYWEWGQNKSEDMRTQTREECDPKDNIFQLKSQIDRGKDYMIEIQTVNEKGSNPDIAPSRLIIPSVNRAPMSPDHFYAIFINNNVQLEWTKVEEACGYTVYWCYQHFSTRNCQSKYGIQWQDNIPPESTNLVIPFHNLDLKAGISVEKFDSELNQTVSSGVTWARCIHKKGAPILPPRNLRYSTDHSRRFAIILWDHPECSKTGYISHYEVNSCRSPADDCTGDYLDCCPDVFNTLVPALVTNWTISTLDPASIYQIRVRSLSFDVASPFSETRIFVNSSHGTVEIAVIMVIVIIAILVAFAALMM